MFLQRNLSSAFTRSVLSNTLQQTRASFASLQSPSPSVSFPWHEPHADDLLQFNPEDVFRAGVRHHHRCNTAYPISHATTIKQYRVPRLRDQEAIKKTLEGAYGIHKEIMLYVHVPFCQTRCQFCEYTVVNPKVGKVQDTQTAYFDALMDEFKLYDDLLKTSEKKLVGFDIGGGTPSMASIADIERVMNAARKHFNLDVESMEVSIETTPKIAAAEPDKIQAYYNMGIRRISMGLQTTDFKQAKELGRDDANAGADYLRLAIENIRKAGFQSFNIDLMYGFPLRSGRADPWGDTVRDCIALQPEHITLYRMRYKGTSMEHLADRVDLAQVNEQEALARQILEEAGYKGATGKNTFSRLPGSSGCSDYLDKRVVKAVPYVGLGLGAQSFSHHTLSYNLGAVTKKLEQYVRSCELGRIPVQDLYHLSQRAAIAKMISVSFYFGGIDLEAFKQCFGTTVLEVFPNEVQFVLEKGLMVLEDGRLQLTTIGKKHFGGVIALFYSPSVQKHVINLAGGEHFERDPLAIINEKLRASKATIERPVPVLNTPPPVTSSVWPLKSGSELWAYNQDTKSWTEVSSRTFSTSSVSSESSSFEATPNIFNVKRGESDVMNEKDSHYEFGNVLFGGACNQKCPFCIGKQLDPQLTPDNLRLWPPRNIDGFIEKMRTTKTKKLIFTGTRTDPQLYKYEEKLLDHLRSELPGIHVSLHTNGLLALRKIDVFNKYDTVTISLNSFKPDTYAKLHGTKQMPDLGDILKQSKIPVKLSCVLTKENVSEVDEYLAIATSLGVKRIAFRHLFNDSTRWPSLFSQYTPSKFFCSNPVYTINGVEVTYWVFDKTSGKSLNLFSDGTISEDYLLAKAPGNLNSSSSFLSISNANTSNCTASTC